MKPQRRKYDILVPKSNRKMFCFSKCTARGFFSTFEITVKICEKHLQRSSSKVASFYLQNWYSWLWFFTKFDHKFNFFFQKQILVDASTYISRVWSDYSHIEKNILTYSLFCNYFSIGFKSISPVTSANFNESSELISLGKS